MRCHGLIALALILALPESAEAQATVTNPVTTPAEERPPVGNTGRFGLGYQVSLGGAQGFSFRYGAGPVVLSGLVGLTFFSPDGEDQDSRFDAEFALGVFFPVRRWDGLHFGLGARLSVATQHREFEDPEIGEDPFGMAFEVPVYGEVWLCSTISLLVESGLVMHVIGDDGSPLAEDRESGLAFLFGDGGLFGSAALTYYF